MSDLGGVGQQIGGELGNIVKKAVAETVKAGGAIAKGTAETVTGSSAGATPAATQPGGQGGMEGNPGSGVDPVRAQKEAAKQKRMAELRADIDRYRQEEAQKEQQNEQVQEEQKTQELQVKKSNQRKREADLIKSTQRQYGGTGESTKKQY